MSKNGTHHVISICFWAVTAYFRPFEKGNDTNIIMACLKVEHESGSCFGCLLNQPSRGLCSESLPCVGWVKSDTIICDGSQQSVF